MKTIYCSIAVCTPIPALENLQTGVKRLAPVTTEWQRARARMLFPTGHNVGDLFMDGMSVAEARNRAAKKCLETKVKYLFFIDYDTIIPSNALCKLVGHLENNPEYDIAAGLYCTKADPPWPLLWREWDQGTSFDFTLGEVLMDRVVGVPMGCTVIRVSLFDRLPYSEENPWFNTVDRQFPLPDGQMARERGTEDLWLCKRLDNELHGKILMDTSVLCDHIDNSTGVIYKLPEDSLPARRAKEEADGMRVILHVGCGPKSPDALPPEFQTDEWKEIRLDIDHTVEPDVVASITDMRRVKDGKCAVVWSSHNLEHLEPWEVPKAMSEFYRVLQPGGVVCIECPDMQAIAEAIGEGKLEEVVYEAPAGPVRPLDMIYGYEPFRKNGNDYQSHRTGFTAETLEYHMVEAGFTDVEITRDSWALRARGVK